MMRVAGGVVAFANSAGAPLIYGRRWPRGGGRRGNKIRLVKPGTFPMNLCIWDEWAAGGGGLGLDRREI